MDLKDLTHYLFYDGAMADIGINYTILLVSTTVMFIPWTRINQSGRYLRLLLFVFFCCLQAAIWWAADAFGISLVWCGQQGFIYLTFIDIFRRRKEELFAAFEVILSISAACLGEIPLCQLLAQHVDLRCCSCYLLRHLLSADNYDCTPSGRC